MEDNFQERNDIVNMVVSFLGQPGLVLMRTCLFFTFFNRCVIPQMGKTQQSREMLHKGIAVGSTKRKCARKP